MRTLYSSTPPNKRREPASRLARLGQTAARRGVWFLALWLTVAAGLAGLGTRFGGVFRDELTVPHSDSQRAVEILEAKFPASAGSAVRIVFRSAAGSLRDPAAANAISASLADVRRGLHVVAVDDPLAPGAPLVSPDGAIALATITYDLPAADLGAPVLDHLEQAVRPAREAGLQVEFGGELLDYVAPLEGPLGEGIGLLAAAVILLLAFGNVVAAGLPLVTAASRSPPGSHS